MTFCQSTAAGKTTSRDEIWRGNVQVLLRMTAGFSFPFLCWRISPLYQQHLRKYNGITHTVLARWRGGDGPGRITSHQMHSVVEKGKSYHILSSSEVSPVHEHFRIVLFYITAFIWGSNCIIMIMSKFFILFSVKRLLMTCPAPVIHWSPVPMGLVRWTSSYLWWLRRMSVILILCKSAMLRS